LVADPEDEVHRWGSAAEGTEARGTLGAMAVTVESDLSYGLGD